MKTIEKLWSVVLGIMLMLCMSFGLVGCDEKKGPIPNGGYTIVSVEKMCFAFTEKSVRDPYGWEIEGDIAEEWVSGSCDYKAKIVEKDGKIYHHIIDPSTGYPADKGLVSVTVISKSSFEADMLSTAIFVMGEEKFVEKLKEFDYTKIITVDKTNNVKTY